jgi:hypothetical protein
MVANQAKANVACPSLTYGRDQETVGQGSRVTHRPAMDEPSKYHLSDDSAAAPAKGNQLGFSTMNLDAATLQLY